MTDNNYQDLVERIYDHVDDALRGIVRYEDGEFEILCKRDDVETATFQRRTEVTIKQTVHRYGGNGSTGGLEESDTYVELFEDVAVVHLPEEAGTGVVFSFELPAAGKLSSFVDDCRSVLETNESRERLAPAED